jgi:hypothetical protein
MPALYDTLKKDRWRFHKSESEARTTIGAKRTAPRARVHITVRENVTTHTYRAAVTSNQAYACACIQLFSLIWDGLAMLHAWSVSPASSGAIAQSEIIRLELVLLIEANESSAWRALLNEPQRSALRLLFKELLDTLSACMGVPPKAALERAQDRLFDAVLEHCGALTYCVSSVQQSPLRQLAVSH